jgi:hypothetical protein
MTQVRLSQIIAVTGGLGSRANASFSEAEKLFNRADLFNGLRRTFEAAEVDGAETVAQPDEVKIVQQNAPVVLDSALSDVAEWFDVCLTRDVGNTVAKANVMVDGQVIVEDAPVPFLLFLADQLGHIRKLLSAIPTLSSDKEWAENPTTGVWESEVTFTNSYVTVKEPLQLHPGNDRHAPQVSVIDKQNYQGKKLTQHQSSAIPEVRKAVLLRRVALLHDAVKQAIQEANATKVEQKKIGHDLFAWLTAE